MLQKKFTEDNIFSILKENIDEISTKSPIVWLLLGKSFDFWIEFGFSENEDSL